MTDGIVFVVVPQWGDTPRCAEWRQRQGAQLASSERRRISIRTIDLSPGGKGYSWQTR